MPVRKRSSHIGGGGLVLIVAVIILAIVIIFGVGHFTLPSLVSANSSPSVAVTLPELQQGGPAREGWDAFWAQFKVWLEELALVFAQMPLVGPLLAGVLNFIGATNVWFCGAVLFVLFLIGAFAIRR